MTKYIDRYYLNGEMYGIKFGGWGWQPWANTLLYCNFNGNYDDTQWNTVTQSYTPPTYSTTAQGEQYISVIWQWGSNNTLLTINPLTGLSWTWDYTVSCWVNPTDNGYLKVIRWYWMTMSNGTGLIISWNNEVTIFIYAWDINTGITITPDVWNNIIFTHTNWTHNIYLNWVLVDTRNLNFVFNNNRLWILGDPNNWWNGLYGWLDEFIVEDRERTAQEISDYYNQTKSLYGIS